MSIQLILPMDLGIQINQNDPVVSFKEVVGALKLRQLEKAFKKNHYHLKNMCREGNRLISADGHHYAYHHSYENRKGQTPRILHVYHHEDWQDDYQDQKIPKTISYDPILFQFQKEAWNRLKSEEGIRLRTQRSIEVEGAFGEIKANSEYTRIQRRGKLRV